ncbi:MAG: hypothetical protein AAF490_26960 [Chloroflexota bacterium]
MNFEKALSEVSSHSAGGSPFLMAFGTTFIITAVLSFLLPDETIALLAMFQGGIALPASLWLEKRISWQRMSAENPLKRLSALLAFSQAMALPALIVIFNVNPRAIPIVLTSLAGVHFVPYAWLHRTNLYFALAFALSAGGFGLQMLFGATAFHFNLLFIGIAYWLTAPLVYRHAVKVTSSNQKLSNAIGGFLAK